MDKINKEIFDSEKNSESPLNLNKAKLQNEMIYLKEDILKDLKNFERNYSEKFTKSNKLINERLEEFEQKIGAFNQKLFEISQISFENKSIKEKIETISGEKVNLADRLLKLNIKFDNFEKKFIEKNAYIENLLNDSIKYPGIIGNNCKFINFHGFIDYTLSQLAKYFVVSQKNALEINSIKKNFDSFNKEVKSQNEVILGSANQYARKIFFEGDNKFKDILKEQERDMKVIKLENEKQSNKLEQTINDIKNKIKIEIEDIENKTKKENEKINILILNNCKDINDVKISFEKLNDELKRIDKKIDIELQKKEIIKESFNNNDSLMDYNEIVVNKYIKGEINEEQFLVYKQFNKLNIMMKNYLNEFLEKSIQSLKYNHSAKYKKSPSINFASQLTSSFNNIISEITIERKKRRTVNNLLHCLELKSGKEKNENIFNRRNNFSKTDFKVINLNNDLKVKTFDNVYNLNRNDIGYKTFQISNIKNFNSINSEDLKYNFNEESKNNDKTLIKEEEEIIKKKKELENINKINSKDIKINERNNITIDCNKNKNQDIIEILEYNNKISNIIQDKTNVNKIRKGLIYSILNNNNKEKEYLNISQKNIMKDNIIKKIKNKTKKEEDLKQEKIKKILAQKKEVDQDKMSLSDFKSFKGKKYLGYEKSFDAKIKEKLISNDINYKNKMKKIKEGIHKDLSFWPNYKIIIPKSKRYIEADNFEKMVNNLNSYLGDSIINNNIY